MTDLQIVGAILLGGCLLAFLILLVTQGYAGARTFFALADVSRAPRGEDCLASRESPAAGTVGELPAPLIAPVRSMASAEIPNTAGSVAAKPSSGSRPSADSLAEIGRLMTNAYDPPHAYDAYRPGYVPDPHVETDAIWNPRRKVVTFPKAQVH